MASSEWLHGLLLRSLLRLTARLDGGELLLRLHVADLVLELRQAGVERRIGELLREVRLGDRVLDMVADRVERAHFVVDRQAIELSLDLEARLRRLHFGEHGVALGLEL